MPRDHEPASPVATLIWGAAFVAAGYFGYTTFSPSDRAQVRSCIASMLESSRGQVGYGEMRDQLRDLDAAETVVIIDESRRAFDRSTLVTFEYRIDGRVSRIVCAQ